VLSFRALHVTEFLKLTKRLTLTFVWCNLPLSVNEVEFGGGRKGLYPFLCHGEICHEILTDRLSS
jgi:hypothetical protein